MNRLASSPMIIIWCIKPLRAPNTRTSVNLPGWFGILIGPFEGFSVSC